MDEFLKSRNEEGDESRGERTKEITNEMGKE
jgi:hypothetical protein